MTPTPRATPQRYDLVFAELQTAIRDTKAIFGPPISNLIFVDERPRRRRGGGDNAIAHASLALPLDLTQWGVACTEFATRMAGREDLHGLAISHVSQLCSFLFQRNEISSEVMQLNNQSLQDSLNRALGVVLQSINSHLFTLYKTNRLPPYPHVEIDTEQKLVAQAVHLALQNPKDVRLWGVQESERTIQCLIVLEKLLRTTIRSTADTIVILNSITDGNHTNPGTLDAEMKRSELNSPDIMGGGQVHNVLWPLAFIITSFILLGLK